MEKLKNEIKISKTFDNLYDAIKFASSFGCDDRFAIKKKYDVHERRFKFRAFGTVDE